MKLEAWLKMTDIKQHVFAEQIGVTQGRISQIIRGDGKPSWELAAKIQRATDGAVRAEDFLPDLGAAE